MEPKIRPLSILHMPSCLCWLYTRIMQFEKGEDVLFGCYKKNLVNNQSYRRSLGSFNSIPIMLP